ncbi:DUF2493 domain-containing protein [Bartonella choladocola]|uniref:YspA cpYpsA-related SLOG domain-containing protein n=1 Tax=Bartonella choladocola TaxID=2750995 RepID=A0A1U9MJ79_9HYPH|nr:DUF2493 domain-containing protein [Bartonella choladocola]AQT47975.1 Protein of unknown function (DUF2493) [Bartonella choladocola]
MQHFEENAQTSPMHHTIEMMSLYGYRPFADEPDGRPVPDENALAGSVADIFDAIAVPLMNTRMEDDIQPIAYSIVNAFHYMLTRVGREIDKNVIDQKISREEQDGSEVKSGELEKLVAEGLTMVERQSAFELMREQAAYHFEKLTGSAWYPRSGSKTASKKLTAAIIDSRDFEAARKSEFSKNHVPEGPKIVLVGGTTYENHRKIFEVLDEVKSHYPDMVLVHGGADRGAERIAANWASSRDVTQIAAKPNWKIGKSAPFKRNEYLFTLEPSRVLVFAGTYVHTQVYETACQNNVPHAYYS